MRLFAAVAVLALLSGCLSVDSDDVIHEPTTGQQLIDLNRAHEQGLISDEEYKRERREILEDN
ncbi:MAG: SHOCT domain-containing protein [Halieaceae bacterium]|jgi:hypothetical protein|nr:SHOCT domain-containing protein [Halieaceae bacterium]